MRNTALDSPAVKDRPGSHSRPGFGPFRTLVLSLLAVAALASPVAAQDGDEPEPRDYEPKIFLHAVPVNEEMRINCFAHGVGGSEDVLTAGTKGSYLIYVLTSDFYADWGVAGVQFGIAFNDEPGTGVDIEVWQSCSDMEWRKDDWPLAGTGNLLTWQQSSNCQKEAPVVLGFFVVEVHSPDKFRLIPRPVDGIASVVSCGITISNSDERTFTPRDRLEAYEWNIINEAQLDTLRLEIVKIGHESQPHPFLFASIYDALNI